MTFETASELPAPIFGEHAQDLIDCNQKLKELGIEKTIKLPQIVVIGDQSTGKSSLIEAISTIKVPKAAGLCTRCPIAINLNSGSSPDAPWTCAVYIEEIFVYEAQGRQKKITKSNPLGPWKERTQTISKRIKVSNSREEVCKLISYAQDQLLHPLRAHHTNFDPDASYDEPSERFSPNIIRLDISQGGWPNLSFVDLPGVIQNAGMNQPDYYVHVVKALAEKYAMDDNNIIILTLPINHDVSNSGSYNIASTNAPDRTIAVFTKVDIAREQEREDVLRQYFEPMGTSTRFALGNHIVMLANSAEMTSEESCTAEEEFFNDAPWKTLPYLKGRLGIVHLQDHLRQVLFQKTAEALPSNLDAIRSRIRQVRVALDNMPDPPDLHEIPYQLKSLLQTYGIHLRNLFTSGVSRSKLLEIMDEFRLQIATNRPTVNLWSETERLQKIEAERAGSESMPVNIDSEPDTANRSNRRTESNTGRTGDRAKTKTLHHRFQLDEIRAINKNYSTSNIPGETEPKALEELDKLSVKNFRNALQAFQESVEVVVQQYLTDSISEAFVHNKHLALYNELHAITRKHLDEILCDNELALHTFCTTELLFPFTLDKERFDNAKEKYIVKHREARFNARATLAKVLKAASDTSKGKQKSKASDEAELRAELDEWDNEIQMSAKTRAYYDIASTRFVDNICQHVLMYLVPGCHRLADRIEMELGLKDIPANRERIAALMSEDQEREHERKRLRIEEQKLRNGLEQIEQVLGRFRTPEAFDQMTEADELVPERDELSPSTSMATGFNSAASSPMKRKSASQAADEDWSQIDESPIKRARARLDEEDLSTPTGRGLTCRMRTASLG